MKLTTKQMVGEALKARHDAALEAVYLEVRPVIQEHCPDLMAKYSDGFYSKAEVVKLAIEQLMLAGVVESMKDVRGTPFITKES
jgi:hypothetical protein